MTGRPFLEYEYMSMSHLDVIHAAETLADMPRPARAEWEASRLRWACALARYTHDRRQELGLTVAEAAELAGLEVSQWAALEDGWVPEELATIRAVAGTLEVRWTDLHMVAFLARVGQHRG